MNDMPIVAEPDCRGGLVMVGLVEESLVVTMRPLHSMSRSDRKCREDQDFELVASYHGFETLWCVPVRGMNVRQDISLFLRVLVIRTVVIQLDMSHTNRQRYTIITLKWTAYSCRCEKQVSD